MSKDGFGTQFGGNYQPIPQQPSGYPQLINQGQMPMQPIVCQPGYTMVPSNMVMVPAPGLEALIGLDTLIIKQKIDELELHLNYEAKNRYVVKKPSGEVLYHAVESSNYFARQCLGSTRNFKMHIVDRFSQDVIIVERPYHFCSDCAMCPDRCECCRDECFISTLQGPLAELKQTEDHGCDYVLNLTLLPEREHTFKLTSPGQCALSCSCSDKKFVITDKNGAEIGSITKAWKGCLTETFTDADNFVLKFPPDMDVRCKGAIIGATFLIDFMHFEDSD